MPHPFTIHTYMHTHTHRFISVSITVCSSYCACIRVSYCIFKVCQPRHICWYLFLHCTWTQQRHFLESILYDQVLSKNFVVSEVLSYQSLSLDFAFVLVWKDKHAQTICFPSIQTWIRGFQTAWLWVREALCGLSQKKISEDHLVSWSCSLLNKSIVWTLPPVTFVWPGITGSVV